MGSRSTATWWLWPAAPLILVVGVSLVGANAVSDEVYERAWRTSKQIDGATTVVLLAVVVAMVAGTMLAAMAERDRRDRPTSTWPRRSDESLHHLRRAYPFLVAVTLLGYAVWVANGIAKGLTIGDVEAVLTTQDNFKLPVKEKLETLPGITTLTQVAIAVTVVGVLIDLHRPSAKVRFAYRFVILLAAARALMLAERLAVAELLVPVLVLRAAAMSHRVGRWRRAALGLAPVLGLALLLVGFAVSEYSRSWNWYSSNSDQDFVEFSSERLLGYYATSHNNGAASLRHGSEFADVPYYTTTFFWEIPPGSQIGGDVADTASDERRRLLRGFGNPEFNSPSGLAGIVSDYGLPGGLLFSAGLGLVLGAIHLSFLHGRILGVLIYPMVFTGLLELPRYLYWFQGRAVPPFAVLLALAGYLSIEAHRRNRGRVGRWSGATDPLPAR